MNSRKKKKKKRRRISIFTRVLRKRLFSCVQLVVTDPNMNLADMEVEFEFEQTSHSEPLDSLDVDATSIAPAVS